LLGGLYLLNELVIREVDNNDLKLKHRAIIQDGAFLGYPFGPLDLNMIIPCSKCLPYLFSQSYIVIILFLFLTDDSVKKLVPLNWDMIEVLSILNDLTVNFAWMFFP